MDNINKIDLSFIIPCHNLEKYIKPLLLSFQMLNLEGINVEYIFVLDDCTDDTEKIIKTYMYTENYKIIHCFEHSCGIARNLGVTIAQGEYIWFVDGDDWLIYPNTVRDCLNLLKTGNLDMIQLKFISNFFNREFYSMVWQYIFKREFILDIKFPSKQPDEDCDFMQQVFKKLNTDEISFYVIPSYFYNYNRPGSNMTQIAENGFIK